jgi:hypothetical protein
MQLPYVIYQPVLWRYPSTVCSRYFPGRTAAHVDNMENSFFKKKKKKKLLRQVLM